MGTFGRQLNLWGYAKNRDVLGDKILLSQVLRRICRAVEMEPLDEVSVNVEKQLEKLGVKPFEDEGGASAVLILSTSHAAIHGWPDRNLSVIDGAAFIFELWSCRDFQPGIVKRILSSMIDYTRIRETGGLVEEPT